MNFDTAFAFTMKAEGSALSMDPVDNGNWTGGRRGVGTLKGSKYGVSAAEYPNEDIANMTLERAAVLAERDYWRPSGCDSVPDPIRLDLFDMAYNSGVPQAIRALQTAAGTPADGKLGPATLTAVAGMGITKLVERFDSARLFHVAEMDPDRFDHFGRGLINRIANAMLQGA